MQKPRGGAGSTQGPQHPLPALRSRSSRTRLAGPQEVVLGPRQGNLKPAPLPTHRGLTVPGRGRGASLLCAAGRRAASWCNGWPEWPASGAPPRAHPPSAPVGCPHPGTGCLPAQGTGSSQGGRDHQLASHPPSRFLLTPNIPLHHCPTFRK